MNFSEQTLAEKTHMHEDRLIREETDLKKYKIELKRRRQIGLTDRSSHRGNDMLGSAH